MNPSQKRPSLSAHVLRFVAIVVASVAGSVSCWLWVSLLLALVVRDVDLTGPAPIERWDRIVWFVGSPMPWVLGAKIGLCFALPAVFCFWSRRLLPALSFVLAVSYAVSAGMIGLAFGGAGLPLLVASVPLTALATFCALVFVRFVPLRYWTHIPPPQVLVF